MTRQLVVTIVFVLTACSVTSAGIRLRVGATTPGNSISSSINSDGEYLVNITSPGGAFLTYDYTIKGDALSVLRTVDVDTGPDTTSTVTIAIVICDEFPSPPSIPCDGQGFSTVKMIRKLGAGKLVVNTIQIEGDLYAFEADTIGSIQVSGDLLGGFVDPTTGFKSGTTISLVQTNASSGGSLETSVQSTNGDILAMRIDGNIATDGNPSTRLCLTDRLFGACTARSR